MNLFPVPVEFLHTDKGPIEDKIKRVEGIIDKGLVINWQVSVTNLVSLVTCLHN